MDRQTVKKVLQEHSKSIATQRPHVSFKEVGYKAVLKKPLKGYKKAYGERDGHVVVELLIPSGATVICGTDPGESHSNGSRPVPVRCHKLRASSAKVLAVTGIRSSRDRKVGYTKSGMFVYKKNKTVRPNESFDFSFSTCSSGIHFFLTRAEAEAY